MSPLHEIAASLRDIAKTLDQVADHVPILDLAEIAEPVRENRVTRDPDLTMVAESLDVIWCKGNVPRLSLREFELVEYLSRRPGTIRSRIQLIDALWPLHAAICDRAVDSTVKRIRAKFRTVDPEFNRLAAVSGAGYVWKINA